jgi:DNA-binding response OmpR family regulator
MRILVIEDDKYVADYLKEGLLSETYAADIACTGEEGQDLAESIPYDLIILDVKLPGKDGFEVCRDLRRDGVNIPIMFITGASCKSNTEVGIWPCDRYDELFQ